jgi:hypothetical protein
LKVLRFWSKRLTGVEMESCGETLLRVASDEGEPIDSIEDCRKCCIEHFAAHTVRSQPWPCVCSLMAKH